MKMTSSRSLEFKYCFSYKRYGAANDGHLKYNYCRGNCTFLENMQYVNSLHREFNSFGLMPEMNKKINKTYALGHTQCLFNLNQNFFWLSFWLIWGYFSPFLFFKNDLRFQTKYHFKVQSKNKMLWNGWNEMFQNEKLKCFVLKWPKWAVSTFFWPKLLGEIELNSWFHLNWKMHFSLNLLFTNFFLSSLVRCGLSSGLLLVKNKAIQIFTKVLCGCHEKDKALSSQYFSRWISDSHRIIEMSGWKGQQEVI